MSTCFLLGLTQMSQRNESYERSGIARPEALAPLEIETLVGFFGDPAVVQLSPRNLTSCCYRLKSFAALPDLAS